MFKYFCFFHSFSAPLWSHLNQFSQPCHSSLFCCPNNQPSFVGLPNSPVLIQNNICLLHNCDASSGNFKNCVYISSPMSKLVFFQFLFQPVLNYSGNGLIFDSQKTSFVATGGDGGLKKVRERERESKKYFWVFVKKRWNIQSAHIFRNQWDLLLAQPILWFLLHFYFYRTQHLNNLLMPMDLVFVLKWVKSVTG